MPLPITENVEEFVSGPATEVKKLNKFSRAIVELQAAVQDLQNAGAAAPSSVTFEQMVVFANGVLVKKNVGTDGNEGQSL